MLKKLKIADIKIGRRHRKDIARAEDPEDVLRLKTEEYNEAFANPFVAASHGLIDDVIVPEETRIYIAQSLQILKSKREIRPQKKHGLIPL